MTVSYQYQVASSTSGGFTRLLFMWRGSLYKLIYRELLLFLSLFALISTVYRNFLNSADKKKFEKIVIYCDTFIGLIPLSFILGFYVTYVAARWWQQYMAIPWPDKVMHLVALYVTGNDDYARMLRRSLMRYLNLSLILVLRSISSAVKRRFPTLDHVVESGFMTSLELELFQSVPSLEFNTYWIPCTWFINLLKEARRCQRLPDHQGLKIIMEEFCEFRSKCGLLWSYDWVSIPLVYTQVVTLATYSFFVVALVGRQFIEGNEKPFQMELDQYLPLFTILQFLFFMGLLKVAEQLINPFGDDEEDFELNWLIDRHTKVSYLGVDILMSRCPPLVKDSYWDVEDITLPYTEAAATYKRKTYRGSVANMTVPEAKQTMFLPEIIEEEENDNRAITPTRKMSNASSATCSHDSPIIINKKNQYHGSPSTTQKIQRDYFDTIVQMDELNCEGETGHLSNGTLKKINMTTPKLEQNRKRFLPVMPRLSRISLQPWPSATNLEESTLSYENSKQNNDGSLQHSLSIQNPSPYNINITRQLTEDNDDVSANDNDNCFVNSAFSKEINDDLTTCKNSFEMNDSLSSKILTKRKSSNYIAKRRKVLRWRRTFHKTTAQVRRKSINNFPLEKKKK
ncbi:hypothetical protein HCN44_001875 [Aphidius gifuensis]|uniref:Bestrophin homolog n=1 Tax=Aphidius gifuensis TaxID=684658 RepID=A0A835CWC2_APHGI|nr:bestrophin-4-like [Aphidius gifuensis]KAF7996243.1 hypothetical protein HCN44_001875 [Aphidius gifuensis]